MVLQLIFVLTYLCSYIIIPFQLCTQLVSYERHLTWGTDYEFVLDAIILIKILLTPFIALE